MSKSEMLKIAKPILFNTEMVRVILDGRKTQTRRVIKPQPTHPYYCGIGHEWDDGHGYEIKPRYKPCDILYVRETWATVTKGFGFNAYDEYIYKASYVETENVKWKPSIHMPKEAARIFLKVTDVRVERLQDISFEDAEAEGVEEVHGMRSELCNWYYEFWNSTIKKSDFDKYGWKANPWVWVYEFERLDNDD